MGLAEDTRRAIEEMGGLGIYLNEMEENDLNFGCESKVPTHISAEAKVSGLTREIDHFKLVVNTFYAKTERQAERIKLMEEEIDSLKTVLSEAERNADALRRQNARLAKDNARLLAAEKKLSKQESAFIRITTAFKRISKKSTKPEILEVIENIKEILTSSDGSGEAS